MNNDEEHLKLLALFHYVVGGIGAVFACLPLIHVGLGVAMLFDSKILAGAHGAPPPAFAGIFFILLGGFLVLLGWAMAVCTIISGRFLAKRKHRTFSFVIAAILCAFMPFGTVLGVFTIIVLSRDSVKTLYEKSGPPRIVPPEISQPAP